MLNAMKRATIYLEEHLHKALKLRSAETATSVSELVNDAVKGALAEDLDDLDAFRRRASEPTVEFETFLRRLRLDGKV
jgi:hypothetical protein